MQRFSCSFNKISLNYDVWFFLLLLPALNTYLFSRIVWSLYLYLANVHSLTVLLVLQISPVSLSFIIKLKSTEQEDDWNKHKLGIYIMCLVELWGILSLSVFCYYFLKLLGTLATRKTCGIGLIQFWHDVQLPAWVGSASLPRGGKTGWGWHAGWFFVLFFLRGGGGGVCVCLFCHGLYWLFLAVFHNKAKRY